MAKKRYNIDMFSKKGSKMDKLSSLDMTNLQFLLNSDQRTLLDFYENSSDDDIAYALELIRYAINENTAQINAVIEQAMDTADTEKYPEANAVLSKFRLK